jgi:hypothetical protein
MKRVLSLSLGVAMIVSLAASDALAKSRKAAPANPPAAEDDFPIPLPKNLTTNQDWLDDGAAAAAKAKPKYMGPNAKANDNYFTQQQDFSAHDPNRYTEMGTIFDDP